MKKIITVFLTIFLAQITYSQDYQTEFLKYCQPQDTIKQLEVLHKWETSNPKDPALFIAYLNYHFLKSRNQVLALTTGEPKGKGFVLKDSLNQTKGFLGSQTSFDPIELKKGLDKIDEGIKILPNQLLLRLEKITYLGETSDWELFTSEIIKTVQHSSINKNQWVWPDEKEENGEEYFLLLMQDYQVKLYNTGDDSLLKNMREIATEILKYYPTHVPSLSNISITYLIAGEYEKGIEALKRAEKINPSDFIVLSNIAHGYKLKGDKVNAIEYYKKVIKHGDEKAKTFAQQQIKELKQ